jgi:hypothetical protein
MTLLTRFLTLKMFHVWDFTFSSRIRIVEVHDVKVRRDHNHDAVLFGCGSITAQN